jgi:DegV family protein with EDD domain
MIKVATDAGIDLPDELINEYDIYIIKNWIIRRTSKGEEEIPDDRKYLQEVLQLIKEGEDLRTAAASIGYFKEVFKKLTEDGSSVIYISFSSKKTRLYYNAIAAKEELRGRRIEVVDSKGGVGMQSFIVLNAAKAAREGRKIEEVLEIVQNKIKDTGVLIVVPDISFFARMGRLPEGKAPKSPALRLMTVIGFTRGDGELYILGRYRTYKQVNSYLVKFIEEELKKRGRSKVNLIVSTADNYEAVEMLKEEVSKREWCNEVIEGKFYPEHVVFLGPGAYSLGYEFV